MKTGKSLEWRAEQKALKSIDYDIKKMITERIVQLQMWIEHEESENRSGEIGEKDDNNRD